LPLVGNATPAKDTGRAVADGLRGARAFLPPPHFLLSGGKNIINSVEFK
jgi:hypothetical protein